MKKTLLAILTASFCLIQGNSQATTSWFSSREVESNVWLISDNRAANIYLIVGSDSAMVVDTGMGVADLYSGIRKLTDKPLIVVNTHGHPDHAGANYQFSKVYLHPADSSDARMCNLPERRADAAQNMLRGKTPATEELFSGNPYNTRLIPVKEGYIFRLGGRNLQVVETPGHTYGGICLLDIENKLLFSGDNNNTLVWLFLPSCAPLHIYLVSLEKQYQRISEFNKLFPGHGLPMPADFIKDQINCVKEIIGGKCSPKPYKSFAGEAMVSTYGRASVAYNPENL